MATEIVLNIANAEPMSQFTCIYKTARCIIQMAADGKIEEIKMTLEWDGFKCYGNPPIKGTFKVGEIVNIFTGKILEHGLLEDAGGPIETLLCENNIPYAVVNGAKRFLFDCRV
jgi:hypothetical protein